MPWKSFEPDLICTRDRASDSLARFRVVILKRDLGFSNRVKVRVHYDDSKDRILVVRAVQLDSSYTEKCCPFTSDLAAALRIFGGSMVETRQLLRAGREQLETREVAAQDRQVLHIFLTELHVYVCTVRLKLWNLARHFDRLRNRSDYEVSIDGSGGVRIENYAGYFRHLETSGLNVHFVGVRD